LKELNGFVDVFHILGNLQSTEFIDNNGDMGVTDPTLAKRFDSYREASDYYQTNKDNYYDNLYPQGVRITVELVWNLTFKELRKDKKNGIWFIFGKRNNY